MKVYNNISLLFLLPLVLSSCADLLDRSEPPCTMQFEMAAVTVLTPEGEPADSVDIITTNKSSDREYDPCEVDSGQACQVGSSGEHIIFHDGFEEDLSQDPEVFVVTGTKGELEFTEEFEFRSDGCHIEQVAGPDTVFLHF